jgi:quercetin dioxygenase-like cupin family protein
MNIPRIIFLATTTQCSVVCAQEIKTNMKPPVTRRTLLKATVDPGKAVAVVDIQEVTMGPNQKAPLHLHPCPTLGVVTAGTIAFQIEGQPVQHLKPGDAFHEPANVRVARFDNDGDTPAKFVVHYLLGKDEHETVRILDQ